MIKITYNLWDVGQLVWKMARMHEEASPKKKGLFGNSNQRKKRIAPKTADQLSKGNQQKIQKPLAIEINIQYSEGKKKDAHLMEVLS